MVDKKADIVLVGIEAEYIFWHDFSAKAATLLADSERTEAKRLSLTRPLVNAGIPEETIQRMNAQELLACELLYVHPETSRFLERPEGQFDIAKLYDAAHWLEFRIRPDSPDRAKANLHILDEAMDKGMQEYGLRLGNYTRQLNFSPWQYHEEDRYYSNIMHPEHPRFQTAGAAIVKSVTDFVEQETLEQKIQSGEGQGLTQDRDKWAARAVIGLSRSNSLRLTGHKLSARIELRATNLLKESSAVDRIIDGISEHMLRHTGADQGVPEVSLVRHPVFSDEGLLAHDQRAMKLVRHTLNGSTLADDGRIVPSNLYVSFNAGKIAHELGILKEANIPEKNKADVVEVLMAILGNGWVSFDGKEPKVTFPAARLSPDRNGIPRIQVVQGKRGEITIDIGGDLAHVLMSLDNFNGLDEAQRRLESIKLLALEKGLAYDSAAAPPEAYAISGTAENPVIRIEMGAVLPEKKGQIALWLCPASGPSTKTGNYEIYTDGALLSQELLQASLMASADRARLVEILSSAGTVEFRGNEALSLLKEEMVPLAVVHRLERSLTTGDVKMDTALVNVREQLGDKMAKIAGAVKSFVHTQEKPIDAPSAIGTYDLYDSHRRQLSAKDTTLSPLTKITIPRDR